MSKGFWVFKFNNTGWDYLIADPYPTEVNFANVLSKLLVFRKLLSMHPKYLKLISSVQDTE